MYAVGIDLGTTYSCVAIFRDDDVQFVEDSGKRLIPSCVAFVDSDQPLVGHRAFRQMDSKPESTVYHFKRMIGCEFSDPAVQSKRDLWPYEIVRDKGRPKILIQQADVKEVWSPESLTVILLKYLKQLAQTHLDDVTNQAVITVPASFNMVQRDITKNAAEQAGFEVLGLLNEPTAAAVAYGMSIGQEDENMLVFDLGGGTCDVTIFQYLNGELTVRATQGDVHLGGEDFDQALVQHCVTQILQVFGKDITKDKIAMIQLRKKCEQAKKDLTSRLTTTIEVTLDVYGIDWKSQIDRKTFEDLNADKFARAITLIEQCLKEAQLSSSEIKSVLLVGGASRMPRIRTTLGKYFDRARISKSMHPDESVARGAAILAAYLSGRTEAVDQYIGKFNDVTPLSFGIEDINGEMYVIFPRNTKVCQSKTVLIEGSKEHSLQIRLYEGENRRAESNYFLGEVKLILPLSSDSPVIELIFELDRDGNISLYSMDGTQKTRTNLVIHYAQDKLCRQDVDYVIRNVQTDDLPSNAVESEEIMERDRFKLEVKRLIHRAKRLAYLSPHELRKVETHCRRALCSMEQFPNQLHDIRARLKHALKPFHI